MGQRTQIIINIKNNDGNGYQKSMAIHNQRGFGRPTVSGVIGILQGIKNSSEFPHTITHELLRDFACRPFGLDEYFKWIEPYDCSSKFKKEEHDNDDGYAIVNMNIVGNDVKTDVKFYTYDGIEKSAWDYIVACGCEGYCTDEWKDWFDKNKHLLGDKKNKYIVTVQLDLEYEAENANEAYEMSQNEILPKSYVEGSWDTQKITMDGETCTDWDR